MSTIDDLRHLDAGLNLSHSSPDYTTSPAERLTAHLARDLARHHPDRHDVDFWALARDLADELTIIAADYHPEHYIRKATA